MNHTTQPSFHEELAAHLAPNEHPKPHPATQGPSSTLTRDEQQALAVAILRLRAEDARKKLAAIRGELPKPTEPFSAGIDTKLQASFWRAYGVILTLALVVGLVRGCAA